MLYYSFANQIKSSIIDFEAERLGVFGNIGSTIRYNL